MATNSYIEIKGQNLSHALWLLNMLDMMEMA